MMCKDGMPRGRRNSSCEVFIIVLLCSQSHRFQSIFEWAHT